MHPFLPSFLASTGINAYNTNQLTKRNPVQRSAEARGVPLTQAYFDRVKDVTGKQARTFKTIENTPPSKADISEGISKGDLQPLAESLDSNRYAAHLNAYERDTANNINPLTGKIKDQYINVNPNADEVYFAHELGHQASMHTKPGEMIRRVRDFTSTNPVLAKTLAAATVLGPGAAALLTPGDDDTDEAIIGALALASPKLIDEALATKNALAIMEKSGQRANLGQRGRLAGGYLSYLAAPIVAATTANAFGNMFDENVPTV